MGQVILSGVSKGMTMPIAGTPISEFAVGSTVKMNVNGTQKDFLIVHQGLPSSLYDSSCDGAWLLMKDIYESRAWHSSNVNDYANSTIHSYLNSTFLGLFDSDIQSIIKQVKIPYRPGSGYDTTVTGGASGLSAKIFLLSAIELSVSRSGMPNDGAELSYFSGCEDDARDSKRVAYLDGSAADWWLRTPFCSSNYGANRGFKMSFGGEPYVTDTVTYVNGIRPALILPSIALVKNDGTIKGAA